MAPVTQADPSVITFGTSGWRGILGEDFTLPRARAVVRAIAEILLDVGGKGGEVQNNRDGGGGGGGAGGSIWLQAGSVDAGSAQVTARGGAGGLTAKDSCHGGDGGAGSAGRVRVDALSIAGTTDPPYIGGDDAAGVTGTPLRVFQPDGNTVGVQNLSFVPLDVRLIVIVP